MYALGDSTPLILRGGGAYNKPETAASYTPPAPASVPLILQGGGTYNYPEVYGASTASSYTPPGRAQADLTKLLMIVGAAVGIGFLLPTRGRRRSLW